MNALDLIVKEMLKQHKGGEKFFDHLDLAVQSKPIIDKLIELIQEKNIIVSGKFGVFFSNYIKDQGFDLNLILVSGGLRKNTPIENLEYMRIEIRGKDFVFVDDSFYSGKTRDVVKLEIERNGGRLNQTYAIYDGSKVKDISVESLYRYYENIN